MELPLIGCGKTMGGGECKGNDSEFGIGHVKFEMPLLSEDVK